MIALVAAFAVSLASSHCELGGMRSPATAAHSCCGESRPALPLDYAACCAVLAAPLPGTVHAPLTIWTADPFVFPPAFAVWNEVLAPVPVAVDSARGLAPPGPARSTEILLVRAAPAHAPPRGFVA